ncbi:MAG: T9SS type A sorting domain-containing protein [Calditrichaeota bacterium]|nr:T9SS type A sorting domain-containing protein [Calditrichota bacterium]
MTRKVYWIGLMLLLAGQTLLAQSKIQLPFEEAFRERKSIHQLEWEYYRKVAAYAAVQPDRSVSVAPLQPREVQLSREVFGYLPYWRYDGYETINYNLLTTIAYFGAEVDEMGNLVDLHHWPASGLVQLAHQNGVRVVLTAILFDTDKLRTLLSRAESRQNLITNLLNQVKQAGADGVTIDFEGVPGDQRDNLTQFMTDLTRAFHEEIPGSFVTIFTPAVDWRNAFDCYALANVTDGLIMQGYDYHWKSAPNAGPVAPLTSGDVWGTYNVTWTVDDYLRKTFNNNSKLILSVPFYGIEWPTADGELNSPTTDVGTAMIYAVAYSNAQNYGRLWDTHSQTPWYKYQSGSQWHQGWYDDSLSLSLKFDLVNERDLKGIAVWALTYDGQRTELQAAISNAFGSTAPPLKPTNFRVVNLGNGQVRVLVTPSAGATAYRLYTSTDARNFQSVDYPNNVIDLSGLSPDSVYYFKVSAVNANGESGVTELLAVRPTSGFAPILIVHGFDRTSGTRNTFDYIKRFAPSVARMGYAFDACANEVIEEGFLNLSDYRAVIWISGEEGTADESFSAAEQSKVAAYLENGGYLFVSGSEIGYDLVAKGSQADQNFYRDYLKAEYVRDKTGNYRVSGTAQGIFAGLSNIAFDDGSHGTYNVDYPDGIRPREGAVMALVYPGFDPATYGGAGIQYEGTFGSGTQTGKLVYLAVGFEAFYPESARDSLMARVLRFFDLPTRISAEETPRVSQQLRLGPNYPNPFNPETTIPFTVPAGDVQPVRLQIFDLLGREVITLVDRPLAPGQHRVVWDGRDHNGNPVPSGTYIYRLQVGDQSRSRKMILLR